MNLSTTPTPSVSPTATSTSTGTGTPASGQTLPDPNSVTPGLAGFLVVFVIAIATWLLLRNMTGRLRRMRFREQERLSREAVVAPPDAGGPLDPDQSLDPEPPVAPDQSLEPDQSLDPKPPRP